MDKFSYVGTSDVNAIESLFLQYSQDPNSVDASWRDFLKGLNLLVLLMIQKEEQFLKTLLKNLK